MVEFHDVRRQHEIDQIWIISRTGTRISGPADGMEPLLSFRWAKEKSTKYEPIKGQLLDQTGL